MPSFSRRCDQEFLHQAAKFNFAQAQMAVVVADDFAEAFQLAVGHRGDQTFFAERFNQAFREHDEAVIANLRLCA